MSLNKGVLPSWRLRFFGFYRIYLVFAFFGWFLGDDFAVTINTPWCLHPGAYIVFFLYKFQLTSVRVRINHIKIFCLIGSTVLLTISHFRLHAFRHQTKFMTFVYQFNLYNIGSWINFGVHSTWAINTIIRQGKEKT